MMGDKYYYICVRYIKTASSTIIYDQIELSHTQNLLSIYISVSLPRHDPLAFLHTCGYGLHQ